MSGRACASPRGSALRNGATSTPFSCGVHWGSSTPPLSSSQNHILPDRACVCRQLTRLLSLWELLNKQGSGSISVLWMHLILPGEKECSKRNRQKVQSYSPNVITHEMQTRTLETTFFSPNPFSSYVTVWTENNLSFLVIICYYESTHYTTCNQTSSYSLTCSAQTISFRNRNPFLPLVGGQRTLQWPHLMQPNLLHRLQTSSGSACILSFIGWLVHV